MLPSLLEKSGLRPGRFRLLFVTLVSYCIGIAIFPSDQTAAAALGTLLLLATILELQGDERKVIHRTIAVVAVLGATSRIVGLFLHIEQLPLVSNALDIVFAGGVTWAVSAAVRQKNRRAGDRIVGAVCVYLLIGFAWAAVYSTVETAIPGSFRIPGDAPTDSTSASFLYFSFVTLSTLGYGDITPVTKLAGTFAWMEAITGQLFIAITVATLISLAIAERQDRKA